MKIEEKGFYENEGKEGRKACYGRGRKIERKKKAGRKKGRKALYGKRGKKKERKTKRRKEGGKALYGRIRKKEIII